MSDPLACLPNHDADAIRIERLLTEAVTVANNPEMTEMTSHLVKAGGKRQRPRLTIAAAMAVDPDCKSASDDVVKGGVAVELVQVGSLYHDDVLDEATIRRNVDSVNARWGNERAILAGDYLLAKASEVAAELGTEVVTVLALTISKLCEGQVAELQFGFDSSRSQDHYYLSIAKKTAALFSGCTRIGGLVGGANPDDLEGLTVFGYEYGMAFQIVDDILDCTLDETALGKPTGNDILEGTYSLPVIFALSESVGDELRGLLKREMLPGSIDRALKLVRESNAIEQSLAAASTHVEKACDALSKVSTNQAAEAMCETARHLLNVVD